jgi:hypothetical protein
LAWTCPSTCDTVNWRTLFWKTCLVYGLTLLLGRMRLTRARRAGVLLLGLALLAIASANLPVHARLQAEQRRTAMRGAQSVARGRVGREGEVFDLVPVPSRWRGGREQDAVSRLRFYGIGCDGRAHPLVMERGFTREPQATPHPR